MNNLMRLKIEELKKEYGGMCLGSVSYMMDYGFLLNEKEVNKKDVIEGLNEDELREGLLEMSKCVEFLDSLLCSLIDMGCGEKISEVMFNMRE